MSDVSVLDDQAANILQVVQEQISDKAPLVWDAEVTYTFYSAVNQLIGQAALGLLLAYIAVYSHRVLVSIGNGSDRLCRDPDNYIIAFALSIVGTIVNLIALMETEAFVRLLGSEAYTVHNLVERILG